VLLPLRLFRNKVSNLGLGTQTIQWLILQGSFFAVSVYLQEANPLQPDPDRADAHPGHHRRSWPPRPQRAGSPGGAPSGG